jgi:hypothetical protein
MSAFDSAMLMIEDLTKQVVELEQQVWDLQLSNLARTQRPKRWICTGHESQNSPFWAKHLKRITRTRPRFINEA